jgi:DNA-binding transcriptional LysR family regulator
MIVLPPALRRRWRGRWNVFLFFFLCSLAISSACFQHARATERVMNIHHLELFYYVARHGGITEAVRNMPYGIQQPAVSGQVAQLEEQLGAVLFHRRPFALTEQGERLYKFIQPFFAGLSDLETELQGGQPQHIRIGASTIVLRDHLPAMVQQARKKFPQLRVALREGYQAELEALLLSEEIELAVTLIEKRATPGIKSQILIELPMVLLVPEASGITDAEQLWQQDPINEPLICMPTAEVISKNLQQTLAKLGVDWFPSIEVSSLDLIQTYVANGFGIGIAVQVPGVAIFPGARVIPLPNFPKVAVGALWRGRATPLVQTFVDLLQQRATLLGRNG